MEPEQDIPVMQASTFAITSQEAFEQIAPMIGINTAGSTIQKLTIVMEVGEVPFLEIVAHAPDGVMDVINGFLVDKQICVEPIAGEISTSGSEPGKSWECP
jgi:hypothetical protein